MGVLARRAIRGSATVPGRVWFDEAVTVFYEALAATFGDPDHSVDKGRLVTVGQLERKRHEG